MEFLMTYGWAILIVIVAIAALFFLGVFSGSAPNTCQMDAPFNCIDSNSVDTVIDLQVGVLNSVKEINSADITLTFNGEIVISYANKQGLSGKVAKGTFSGTIKSST